MPEHGRSLSSDSISLKILSKIAFGLHSNKTIRSDYTVFNPAEKKREQGPIQLLVMAESSIWSTYC